jgi:hypothetical protein
MTPVSPDQPKAAEHCHDAYNRPDAATVHRSPEGRHVAMNAESLKSHGLRALASRRTWWAVLTIYILMVLVLFGPVLLAPISGDDTYWITAYRAAIPSYWQAWWAPLPHAFDFSVQSRGTALAVSERRVLALFTMDAAKLFSVPPYLVWGLVKTALVGVTILSVAVFLKQVRFRDRRGAIRGLSRSTTVFITLAMPLTFALGVKSQNIASLNGYNFYPSLTYGPFAGYLLMAALVLSLSRRLETSYRSWAAPVIVLMMFVGLIVNLSYELVALMVPVAALVLLLQPFSDAPTRWLRWRARLTVLAPLGVTYTAIFVWIRLKMAAMPCHATDTCYAGTTVDIKPKTLAYNFLASFPGNTAGLVGDQARAAGRGFPGVSSLSVTIAVIATLSLLVLWASWTARTRLTPECNESDRLSESGDDSKGLFVVLAVAALIAVGSAGIMGITEIAARLVTSAALPNRNGVITWSALSLLGLVVVRLTMNARWGFVRPAGLVALAAVMVVTISLYFPRNVLSAQQNRVLPFTVLVDSIHREVAMGDTSAVGDARRCAAIADAFRGTKIPSGEVRPSGVTWTLEGAYTAFRYYYGTTYCSKNLGRTYSANPGTQR